MVDESDLVSRAKRGDREAFGQLALMYRRPVTLLAHRICGNWHVAGDLCQDAFVKAYTSLCRFEWYGEDSFRRWILRIAHYTCIDYLRGERREVSLQQPIGAPGPERYTELGDQIASDSIDGRRAEMNPRRAEMNPPARMVKPDEDVFEADILSHGAWPLIHCSRGRLDRGEVWTPGCPRDDILTLAFAPDRSRS